MPAEPTKKRRGCKIDFWFWNINIWPRWCHYHVNLLTWCRSFRNKASFACWRNQLFLISTHSAPLLTWKYAHKIWSQIVGNYLKFCLYDKVINCEHSILGNSVSRVKYFAWQLWHDRRCIRWIARTNLKIQLANQNMKRGRDWRVLIGAKRHFCTQRSLGTGCALRLVCAVDVAKNLEERRDQASTINTVFL